MSAPGTHRASAGLSEAASPWLSRLPPAAQSDTLAPLTGQWLSERNGQPFVVESRPGAGGNIGTEAVVRAAANGYTLLLIGPNNAISATVYDKLNFNFIRYIAPVAGIHARAAAQKKFFRPIPPLPGAVGYPQRSMRMHWHLFSLERAQSDGANRPQFVAYSLRFRSRFTHHRAMFVEGDRAG